MDWTTIITALLSAISGGGIMGIFYYKETRKKKSLENDAMASDAWQKLFERTDKELDEAREERKRLEEELQQLRAKINSLEAELSEYKANKCEVLGCPNRIPPRKW